MPSRVVLGRGLSGLSLRRDLFSSRDPTAMYLISQRSFQNRSTGFGVRRASGGVPGALGQRGRSQI